MALNDLKLTFRDEFNSLSLDTGTSATDPNFWNTSMYNGTVRSLHNNGELQWYMDKDYKKLGVNPFEVNNGILSIKARPASAAVKSSIYGYNYTSGALTSADEFSQKYGYFEVRAKVPDGKGLWPAFWLLADHGGWPPEIDVMEILGHDTKTVHQTTHTTTGTGKGKATVNPTKLSDGFHNYGVDWTKDKITFYLDGKETWSRATPADMHTPMYMLLNLAVGGHWPGSPNANTNFNNANYQIDYVRAYQHTGVAGSGSPLPAGSGSTSPGPSAPAVDPMAGHNVLKGTSSNDVLRAGAGNDVVYASAGWDVIDGGAGIDTLTYIEATTGVTVDLGNSAAGTGMAKGDQITSVEILSGSNHADTLRGTASDDTLLGANGSDTIGGGDGNDTLQGGDGNDQLFGGNGGDVLLGGSGNDLLSSGMGTDLVDGGPGIDTAFYGNATSGLTIDVAHRSASTGDAAGDILRGIEVVQGSAFNDVIRGGSANDILLSGAGDDVVGGAAGNDTLQGNDGNDHLFGGTGNDVVAGGNGNDWLYGESGNNSLSGGAGTDVFQILAGAHAYISDYKAGIDFVQIKGVSASNVRVRTSGNSTLIDLNGNTAATLSGVTLSSNQINFAYA